MKEGDSFASLYYEMDTCISILHSFEDQFIAFQAELSEISADIKMLQDTSVIIHKQIGNRLVVKWLILLFTLYRT